MAESVPAALRSPAGFGGSALMPSPIAMPAGHPFAKFHLTTVRRNYQVRHEEFLELERSDRPASSGRRRSFIRRTENIAQSLMQAGVLEIPRKALMMPAPLTRPEVGS